MVAERNARERRAACARPSRCETMAHSARDGSREENLWLEQGPAGRDQKLSRATIARSGRSNRSSSSNGWSRIKRHTFKSVKPLKLFKRSEVFLSDEAGFQKINRHRSGFARAEEEF